MASWGGKADQGKKAETVTASKSNPEAAKSKDKKYNKSYTITANLNMHTGAGINKDIITTIPKGSKVTYYGYYTKAGNIDWLFVQYGKYTGFVSKSYIKGLINADLERLETGTVPEQKQDADELPECFR